jgi:hypothetical protein
MVGVVLGSKLEMDGGSGAITAVGPSSGALAIKDKLDSDGRVWKGGGTPRGGPRFTGGPLPGFVGPGPGPDFPGPWGDLLKMPFAICRTDNKAVLKEFLLGSDPVQYVDREMLVMAVLGNGDPNTEVEPISRIIGKLIIVSRYKFRMFIVPRLGVGDQSLLD